MSHRRFRRLAVAALFATALAGCGLGAGERSEGEATLTVTRDYGRDPMVKASLSDPSESETVIRFLDREAEIETRYGGGFVQSIGGVSGTLDEGRGRDWFFYVNGMWSPRGSAEVEVRGGDRIWWDYRDWTDAMRVPAVVGSWPEPFARASAGAERSAVRVECHGARPPCEEVAERLSDEGVEASVESPNEQNDDDGAAAPRLLVGPWSSVRRDPVAALLGEGPSASGVFARFERSRSGYRLVGLDERAEPVLEGDSEAGLVAALRDGEEPATWLVTGTDPAGVEAAAATLGPSQLADRYALFASAESELALPARPASE